MHAAKQPSLFDGEQRPDVHQAAFARARMREMIDRMKETSVPPWRNEAEVILDDGAFQRAMRLLPPPEAQALWTEFNEQMERLYAIWAKGASARA